MPVPGQPAAGRLPSTGGAAQGEQPQGNDQYRQQAGAEEKRAERQAKQWGNRHGLAPTPTHCPCRRSSTPATNRGTLPGNNRLNPVRSPFLLKELIPMAKATARHILVATEDKCNELKTQIEGGADFADVAKANSSCPSSRQGGDLGSFGPGQMVKEFDAVVFSAPVNTVQGPVKTQFGYHLLEVTSRQD